MARPCTLARPPRPANTANGYRARGDRRVADPHGHVPEAQEDRADSEGEGSQALAPALAQVPDRGDNHQHYRRPPFNTASDRSRPMRPCRRRAGARTAAGYEAVPAPGSTTERASRNARTLAESIGRIRWSMAARMRSKATAAQPLDGAASVPPPESPIGHRENHRPYVGLKSDQVKTLRRN